MKVLQRYFAREITQSVLFVLAAFLAIFAFFDLTGEMQMVGRGNYRLEHAFLYVGLGLPARIHELMPVAALIGTIYTLAQFASRSEFTIMRVSSMSTLKAAAMLGKIGIAFALVTFVFGEFIEPVTTQKAKRLKLHALGSALSQEFRSGLWAKDVIKQNGVSGAAVGTRFVNVGEVRPDGQLQNVTLYEFDLDLRMQALVTAKRAEFRGDHTWRMLEVEETRFARSSAQTGGSESVATRSVPGMDLVSEITPKMLSVLFSDPDRMSAYDLAIYKKHLAENRQDTARHEIAFWKKVTYPFAVFVMMALALPFAYVHFRSGGLSLKIFIGIMIGVSFELINTLFSNLGLLNTWPPLATAMAPSLLFVLLAVAALWWAERH